MFAVKTSFERKDKFLGNEICGVQIWNVVSILGLSTNSYKTCSIHSPGILCSPFLLFRHSNNQNIYARLRKDRENCCSLPITVIKTFIVFGRYKVVYKNQPNRINAMALLFGGEALVICKFKKCPQFNKCCKSIGRVRRGSKLPWKSFQ